MRMRTWNRSSHLTTRLLRWATPLLCGLAACSSNNTECSLTDPGSCSGGQVCEAYSDSSGMHNACFAPTELKGIVTNAVTGAPIAGARVIASDGDSHAAVGSASTTDAQGRYTVRVTAPRTANAKKDFTLRVSAAGYGDFPDRVRVALPIAVRFVDPKGTATIDGPVDVVLIPITMAPPGSIAGKVLGPKGAGVLVVAEGGSKALSGVSDSTGAYVIFNVPDGTYTVRGYFIGATYVPAMGVVVAGAPKTGVDLAAGPPATGVLTGSLSYVAGADNKIVTSVVLRLQSTREVPPGFSLAAGDAMPYRLEGIPDGTYDVLAAYPNDNLVKDPDPNQGGTQTPVVMFSGGGTKDVGSFKITAPVDIIGPDASAPVAGTPTFTWNAYPSTESYDLEVFDADGNSIWKMPGIMTTSLPYGGPALTPGRYYQWRITAFHQCMMMNCPQPISLSEDLRGVWRQM